MAEQLQRTFLIEGVEDHKVSVWTLEEVLREINRDSECTDEDGDVYIEGRYVMAGSPEDTVDHEKMIATDPTMSTTGNRVCIGWITIE